MTPSTPSEVNRLVKGFTKKRYDIVENITDDHPDSIGPSLILALGIRESDIQNVTGDGGHGRGWLQIDDRSHLDWLSQHNGCKSGSWSPAKGRKASERGYCPTLTASVMYAIELLLENRSYGHSQGVRPQDLDRFMVAAYNCGAGNAITAYREHGIGGIDARTANGNYSHDVFIMKSEVAKATRDLGWSS